MVESTSLLTRRPLIGTVGSNPTVSVLKLCEKRRRGSAIRHFRVGFENRSMSLCDSEAGLIAISEAIERRRLANRVGVAQKFSRILCVTTEIFSRKLSVTESQIIFRKDGGLDCEYLEQSRDGRSEDD